MNDLNVIDAFLDAFAAYIDSGFGLLQPDVAYLTTFLVTLDITSAGLFWAWGGGNDVVQSLVRKVLYVGFFALRAETAERADGRCGPSTDFDGEADHRRD